MANFGKFEEEDCAQLQFGKDFQQAPAYSISEAVQLLHRIQKDAENEQEGPRELSEVFKKSIEYVQKFARFTNLDTMMAIKDMLKTKEFHPFEAAQLVNLCPETADEAKSLIPSLEERFSDADLQGVLDDLLSKRSFQP